MQSPPHRALSQQTARCTPAMQAAAAHDQGADCHHREVQLKGCKLVSAGLMGAVAFLWAWHCCQHNHPAQHEHTNVDCNPGIDPP